MSLAPWPGSLVEKRDASRAGEAGCNQRDAGWSEVAGGSFSTVKVRCTVRTHLWFVCQARHQVVTHRVVLVPRSPWSEVLRTHTVLVLARGKSKKEGGVSQGGQEFHGLTDCSLDLAASARVQYSCSYNIHVPTAERMKTLL